MFSSDYAVPAARPPPRALRRRDDDRRRAESADWRCGLVSAKASINVRLSTAIKSEATAVNTIGRMPLCRRSRMLVSSPMAASDMVSRNVVTCAIENAPMVGDRDDAVERDQQEEAEHEQRKDLQPAEFAPHRPRGRGETAAIPNVSTSGRQHRDARELDRNGNLAGGRVDLERGRNDLRDLVNGRARPQTIGADIEMQNAEQQRIERPSTAFRTGSRSATA